MSLSTILENFGHPAVMFKQKFAGIHHRTGRNQNQTNEFNNYLNERGSSDELFHSPYDQVATP